MLIVIIQSACLKVMIFQSMYYGIFVPLPKSFMTNQNKGGYKLTL